MDQANLVAPREPFDIGGRRRMALQLLINPQDEQEITGFPNATYLPPLAPGPGAGLSRHTTMLGASPPPELVENSRSSGSA